MQCNTNYTVSEENFNYINLNVLKVIEKIQKYYLGLSDHTLGHSIVLGAISLGAKLSKNILLCRIMIKVQITSFQ